MFAILKQDYNASEKRIINFTILLIYRIGNSICYSKIPNIIKKIILVFLKIIQKIYSDIIFKVEIPFETKIGSGLRINHPQGIIISKNAVIGERCTIFHQVTIGANEHKNSFMKAPKIGRNVYIGAGAKIIGDIIIGDNVKIGANAVVSKNVPDGSTVIEFNKIIVSNSEREIN